jgi:hypothetical protein
MSDGAREAFAAMVEELNALGEARQRSEKETQAGFDAALLVAAHPTGKGKPPKDAEAAWKKLPEDQRKAIRAEWTEKADTVWSKFNNANTSLEYDLRALAEHVPVRAGVLRVVVDDRSSSTYRSTSRGGDYARAGATITAEGLKSVGVAVSVVPTRYCEVYDGPDEPAGFRVIALVEAEVDGEVLKRLPGVPFREWVRLCWKLGVNPRVFNPYLPHGYEEREGLDFFGGDKRAGVVK